MAAYIFDVVQIDDVQVIGMQSSEAALDPPANGTRAIIKGIEPWAIPTALRNLYCSRSSTGYLALARTRPTY